MESRTYHRDRNWITRQEKKSLMTRILVYRIPVTSVGVCYDVKPDFLGGYA